MALFWHKKFAFTLSELLTLYVTLGDSYVALNSTKRTGKAEPSLVSLYPKRSVGAQGLKKCTAQEMLKQVQHDMRANVTPNDNHVTLNLFQGLIRSLKPAFTLSELLMSVLVISVILISLSPIITKRVNDNINVTSIKTQGVLFRIDETDPTRCNITADEGTADPENCTYTIPNNVNQINAVVVGKGGNGSNTASSGIDKHVIKGLTASDTYRFSKTMVDEDDGIEKLVKNLKIEYIVSGGAGGGAAWGGAGEDGNPPQSQADCNEAAGQERDVPNFKAKTKFIPSQYTGTDGVNLCVTKYNMGDENGPTIPDDVIIITDGNTCPSGTACCYQGQITADPSACTATGNYPACNRTLCNTYVAFVNNSCFEWAPIETTAGKWRGATRAEISGIVNQILLETSIENAVINNYLGADGLQLCIQDTDEYGYQCQEYYPDGYYFFSGTFMGRQGGLRIYSNKFNLVVGDYGLSNKYYAYRCVLDVIPSSVKANSGSGGNVGADSYSYDSAPIVVHNGLIERNIDLIVSIGQGGDGATQSKEAQLGGATTVTYNKYDSLGALTLSESVSYVATSGIGGDGTADEVGKFELTKGKVTKNGSSEEFDAGTYTTSATNGNTKTLTADDTAKGGIGGSSIYNWILGGARNTAAPSGGGDGGSFSNSNGQDGFLPGSGGGGGTVILDEDGEYNYGHGGKGANGAVIISYDLVPPPAAGAGGAGGGMVVGRNISVTSGESVSVSFLPTTLNIGDDLTIEAASGQDASTTQTDIEGVSFLAGVADLDGGSVSSDTNRQGTFKIKQGQDGKAGKIIEGTSFKHGGYGGISGTGAQGACGGLNRYIDGTAGELIYSENCIKNIITAKEVDGSTGVFNVDGKNIVANSFGFAGTGGGGGGYGKDLLGAPIEGTGGQGAQGYVYIWWVKAE